MKWTTIKKDSSDKWETRVAGRYSFSIDSEKDAQEIAVCFIDDILKELQNDKDYLLTKINDPYNLFK